MLIFSDYQTQAAVFAGAGAETQITRLQTALHGLSGEWGEINEYLLKFFDVGRIDDRRALTTEAGDFLWYIAEWCTALDKDLGLLVSGKQDSSISAYQYATFYQSRNGRTLGVAICKINAILGDFHEAMKKHTGHGQKLEFERLSAAVRQLVAEFRLVCNISQIDMETAATHNLKKLLARHGANGFSPEYHLERGN